MILAIFSCRLKCPMNGKTIFGNRIWSARKKPSFFVFLVSMRTTHRRRLWPTPVWRGISRAPYMWVWPDWHKYENYNFDATHLKASWAMSTGSVLMEFTVHPCIYPYYAPLAHYSSPAHQISVLRSVVSDVYTHNHKPWTFELTSLKSVR